MAPPPPQVVSKRLDQTRFRALGDLDAGEKAIVRRVPDGDPELLRYLSELSLVPGNRVGWLGIGSGLNCMMLGIEW